MEKFILGKKREPSGSESIDDESTAPFAKTMLKSFSSIKEIFCQYNTVSPSSAPVERLFSRGSLVFGQKRLRLLDSNFEKHLMVNANRAVFLENKL